CSELSALCPRALRDLPSFPTRRSSDLDQIWKVLESFASFGFCKAHAAAFALPTYQSAWLKTHWPAHFLAGVLTHDPGMYPKRLIDRKSTRLNSSHVKISYAVFCLKKKR